MKLKRYFLIAGLIIILIPICMIIFLNINVHLNRDKNDKVISSFNEIFKEQILEIALNYENDLPKLQLEGTDYVGIISINDLVIPVESKCSSSLISIQSLCKYNDDKLTILGTNLKDSFVSFEEYDVDDMVTFTNMLGESYKYRIEKIKRIDNLDIISKYDGDLIIVIKNYYDMEYVVFICNSY